MNYSIGNKLFASGIIILFFVLLMIIANQAVVRLFNNTSTRLVVEYNELDAIQEFKVSLGKLLVATNNYMVFGEVHYEADFKTLISESNEYLMTCRSVVTERHNQNILVESQSILVSVDSLINQLMINAESGNETVSIGILKQISEEIYRGINGIDVLLAETKLEIDEYVSINNTVIKHGTITVLTLGLIVLLIILIGGILFIKTLTNPIKELVSTTEKISKGDKRAKVQLSTRDTLLSCSRSLPALIKFIAVGSVLHLDGFLFELPGEEFHRDVESFGEGVRRVLKCISDADPLGYHCMNKSFLSKVAGPLSLTGSDLCDHVFSLLS